MPRVTKSTVVCAALWIAASAWLFFTPGGPGDVDRLLLAGAIAATVVAAAEHHVGQLAEIAAISYRAGVASRGQFSRVPAGDHPAEDRESPRG